MIPMFVWLLAGSAGAAYLYEKKKHPTQPPVQQMGGPLVFNPGQKYNITFRVDGLLDTNTDLTVVAQQLVNNGFNPVSATATVAIPAVPTKAADGTFSMQFASTVVYTGTFATPTPILVGLTLTSAAQA